MTGPVEVHWRYADGKTDTKSFGTDYIAAAQEFLKLVACPGIITVVLTDFRQASNIRLKYEVTK